MLTVILRENQNINKQITMKKQLILILLALCSTPLLAQPPSYIPTNGLVGWWPFNGNANDESGNGNNGTLVGGTVLTTDRLGNLNSAYAFDGIGDYIDCGNAASLNITGSITISAWLFASDFNDTRGIVSKSALPPVDDAYQLVAGPYVPSDLNFLNSDYGYLVPTLSWVHVVSVFDSSSQTISLYTNGLLDTTISVAFNSIGTSTDNLCLGTHRPTFTPNWSWSGTLDDIGIWNRALSQTEITQIFSETVASNCNPFTGSLLTGLVASYPFCGNSNDESGNNNHSSAINGAALTQDRFSAANNAYYLDGVDDWIETNTNFYDPSTPHTLSIWWQTTDSTKMTQELFNTNPHPTEVLVFNSNMGPSYDLHFGLGDGIPGSWSIVSPDTALVQIPSGFTSWHNTIWTRSATNWTIYQDGVSVLTYTSSLNTIPTNCTLRFGAENNLPSGGAQFKGNIDDIGIWDRALSASEVQDIFVGNTTSAIGTFRKEINLYPNPTQGSLTVFSREETPYVITDQLGRNILSGKLPAGESVINLQNLTSGVYFLRTSLDNKTHKILRTQ